MILALINGCTYLLMGDTEIVSSKKYKLFKLPSP